MPPEGENEISMALLVILAILLPPLAVGLKKGVGGALILAIVLWLLFYVPGLVYALYVVFKG
ncbi:MAG: YqaE/Pmp3 family membrane protein [Phycisphaerales bacterium JB040]